ncbi:agmatinase [Blastomyces dermatitidis ER-3]|uniref:Agmatinase n=2 Tax=Ajellomyces dermatitidis TaxID=5039 RepID=F2TUP5_AJEDA|nr:agmatinase [Blastomyces dermatitidis ER-3]EEQ91171.2 agmatinase [Blastomyces dermatitidis ER-3]EGE86958.2 agmatinase [Blastomyces dermatitidis ATCC 18188]EQL30622.1 arginase [Blastomyces dermatitidis ATCC 26199]
MRHSLFLLQLLAELNRAADIVFPPVAAIHGSASQAPLGLENTIDIVSGSQFSGLMTFANVPYVNCFVDSEAEKQRYDIAFMGAPFDTGVTARPGARFGPGGIRRGSQRIRPDGAWSIYTGENVFQSWASIVDCGDVPLTFLDNTVALKQLDKAHKVVSSRPANASDVTRVPRIITLGGDHTTTLPALRSTYKHWGPVAVIHFDSHIDTWDPSVLGGGISNYAGVNHGTFLHIAHEEGLVLNSSSIHVGIRAPVVRPKKDIENDIRCGFDIITARDIDHIGTSGIVEKIKKRVGNNKAYISVDIDVLDPAFAPATGTSEPGGFSTRELLTILDALVESEIQVVGADVVEVAPIYDTAGESTVLAAAEVAHSLLALIVRGPV